MARGAVGTFAFQRIFEPPFWGDIHAYRTMAMKPGFGGTRNSFPYLSGGETLTCLDDLTEGPAAPHDVQNQIDLHRDSFRTRLLGASRDLIILAKRECWPPMSLAIDMRLLRAFLDRFHFRDSVLEMTLGRYFTILLVDQIRCRKPFGRFCDSAEQFVLVVGVNRQSLLEPVGGNVKLLPICRPEGFGTFRDERAVNASEISRVSFCSALATIRRAVWWSRSSQRRRLRA